MKVNSICLVFAAALAVVSGNPMKTFPEGKEALNGTLPAPHLNGTTLTTPLNGTNATVTPSHNGSTLLPHLSGCAEAPILNGSTVLSNGSTTPSPLNGTTDAPLNGSTPLPTCNGTTLTPSLNGSTTPSPLNETTTPTTPKTTSAPPKRFRRDCKSLDVKKIEPKMVSFLEEQFEMFFNGSIAEPILTNAHQSGSNSLIGQNAEANADKNNGTAVASAVARSSSLSQNVKTNGSNAMSDAKSHKGVDNVVQSVEATGSQTGVANALIDRSKSHSNNSGVAVQEVFASGKNSAATGSIQNHEGNSMQDVKAIGDNFAVAATSLESATNDPIATKANCATPLKLDAPLRKFIRSTVKKAIENLKKDLEL